MRHMFSQLFFVSNFVIHITESMETLSMEKSSFTVMMMKIF